ncbi:MAG: peptidyl-prolyl cis-trans isomerase [Myxococcales bacterium]|nr:peptidyl-prolyl cis-trans isomerase [Myxococcales bacterium]
MNRRDPINWLLPTLLGVGVLISGLVLFAMNVRRVRESTAVVRPVYSPRPVEPRTPTTPTTPPTPTPPPETRESIHVSHLVVMYRGSQRAAETIVRTRAQARARADEALNRLLSGSEFPALVAEFSDEPGAPSRRGDLGRIRRGQTVARFEAAAFALRPGQTSGVVETEFGYHVIHRWPDAPDTWSP